LSEYSTNLAALFHVATSSEPPPAPEHLSVSCKEFIEQCLIIDPDNRATALHLIQQSPFLKEEFEKALAKKNQSTLNLLMEPQQLYQTPAKRNDRVQRSLLEGSSIK
jgi:serine/threonine protein kinase